MGQERERILVAMSGGVDSSVAAAILAESGADILGVYMKNWAHEPRFSDQCPWQRDIEDARAVTEKIGIEFRVLNLIHEYKKHVVDYLLKGYEEGITPNPDIICNREIKFGVLLNYALEHGFSSIATGHYVRKERCADGSFQLLQGKDPHKDQSYFLSMLKQEQVARAHFPLGEMLKSEVRLYAKKLGLSTSEKKDSQGICFIGKVRMSDFLSSFLPNQPGNIVNLQGKVLGQHKGLHFYTLGQRRGIGVASNTPNQAYVVVEKKQATNELVVTFDEPSSEKLYSTKCTLSSLSFVGSPLSTKAHILARPRYRAQATPAIFEWISETNARLLFQTPQRALTPGQICALYDGDILLGGGVFHEIHYDKNGINASTLSNC